MTDRISRRFCEIVGKNKVLEQEPMARHTTFRIGGPADYFVELGSIDQIRAAIKSVGKKIFRGLCWEEEATFWSAIKATGE